jgi:NAD(P)-dependent dehydrogenase (short-subunit alcohol dehydrogenase family)
VTDFLKGKVAIVTGAGSVPGAQDRPPIGNGRAAAIVYAREGAKVFAVDIDMDTPTIYKELTKLYDGNVERMRKDRNDRIPMKSMGEASDVAYASLFLVSSQAKYITGQILGVDGGGSLT